MRLAISAQERPARNALTVVVSYVNPTRKPMVDAARSSAHPVYRCIKACTRKEPQRTTAKISLAKAHSCAGLCESVLWTEKKEVSRRANETRSTCAQSFIGSCLRRRRRHYWRCCRLDESCRQRVPRLQPASPHIPRCPGLVRPSKA